MKTIKYCITNPDISNSFEIDESKCQTYEQLLKSIAANLQIKESQFSIENPPKDKNLNSIDSNYIFKLKINSGCGEITFRLPNGKALNIKEGNKYTFQQIIDYFKTNGICYSQECQDKNLHFKILGKEISKSQFPLKNILPIFVVEVELEGNYITMNYDQKEFIFSENEQSYSAIGFIYSQFEKYTKFENIKIQIKNLNRYLASGYKLKHDEEYVINIKYPFYFCHTSISGHKMHLVMDYNSTISDAQNLLPSMLCEDGSIKPKDIVIYDKDKKEIKDGKVLLRNVMDNHFGIPFYFPVSVSRKQSAHKNIGLYKPKVTPILTSKPDYDGEKNDLKKSNEEKSETKSIEIKFMFDESSEEKFDSYSENVSIDKTIEELQEEIRQKFNIDKRIIIGYKSGQNLFEMDYDMNIEDVIDDIKTETNSGETENVLYIKITQKPKKTKSTRPMKPKSITPPETDKPKPTKQEPSKPKQPSKELCRFIDSEMFKNFIENKKFMGSGGTSIVYKVKNLFEGKGLLALKMLKKELFNFENKDSKPSIKGDWEDDDDFEEDEEEEKNEIPFKIVADFFKEFEILLNLQHPNIIKTYGFYQGDQKNPPSFLLEYCKYNLQSAIDKLNNIELIKIVHEICSAMEYLHKNNVIHRDLKITNILVNTQKEAKICDFGISKIVDDTMTSMTHEIGTLIYMAPELFDKNSKYNNKVDVYSFGVVLYFIMTKGSIPAFNQKVPLEDLEIPKSVNKLSRNLIKKCWSFSSELRPSFTEIIRIIVDNNFRLFDEIEEKDIDSLRLSLNIEK